jgi:hypothetical protein
MVFEKEEEVFWMFRLEELLEHWLDLTRES